MTASDTTSNCSSEKLNEQELFSLAQNIKRWGKELGFDEVGITDTELSVHEAHLNKWVEKGMHGNMNYMHKHGTKRTHPEELVEGTQRIISVRMDYAPADIKQAESILGHPETAYISRYALGRDYHKVIRNRLKKLADKINDEIGEFGYRAFTDSAPVLEKALAEKSGLGWIGKHSNLLDSKTGSWFFLGELYVDLKLPIDTPATNHCGSCNRCIDVCPTNAIVGPYQVDARLCVSYLTIELKEAIPVELRDKIGNRIYGCDDCQFTCPWNKFAQTTKEADFSPRENITDRKLIDLFNWDEKTFLKNTEGSAIRRIGHDSWLRNIAVAMGNAPASKEIISCLENKRDSTSEMVKEHIDWALNKLKQS